MLLFVHKSSINVEKLQLIDKLVNQYMKILYIANARIPTEKAHGINMVEMCQAFSELGHTVTMAIPKKNNPIDQDLFGFYGIKNNFKVKYLKIINPNGIGRFWFTINWISFAISVIKNIKQWPKGDCTVFTRDEFTGRALRFFGYTVIYDMHGFPETARARWRYSMRGMSKIVVTNNWKKIQCQKVFGIDNNKILVAQNGFDPDSFKIKQTKEELIKELDLPNNNPIAIYTGHLYDWKGTDIMAEAAKTLPNINFFFVGGRSKDVADFRKKYSEYNNIHVLGQKPHQDIPKYLKAADILILPNTKVSSSKRLAKFSEFDTSPIKLFEYMASGTPIVVTDLPSILEVVNQDIVTIVKSGSSNDLAKGIKKTLQNSKESKIKANLAKSEAQNYTWKKRASNIIEFIK